MNETQASRAHVAALSKRQAPQKNHPSPCLSHLPFKVQSWTLKVRRWTFPFAFLTASPIQHPTSKISSPIPHHHGVAMSDHSRGFQPTEKVSIAPLMSRERHRNNRFAGS
jgi:hypothetical protein